MTEDAARRSLAAWQRWLDHYRLSRDAVSLHVVAWAVAQPAGIVAKDLVARGITIQRRGERYFSRWELRRKAPEIHAKLDAFLTAHRMNDAVCEGAE